MFYKNRIQDCIHCGEVVCWHECSGLEEMKSLKKCVLSPGFRKCHKACMFPALQNITASHDDNAKSVRAKATSQSAIENAKASTSSADVASLEQAFLKRLEYYHEKQDVVAAKKFVLYARTTLEEAGLPKELVEKKLAALVKRAYPEQADLLV